MRTRFTGALAAVVAVAIVAVVSLAVGCGAGETLASSDGGAPSLDASVEDVSPEDAAADPESDPSRGSDGGRTDAAAPASCGWPGHDCRGAACVAGKCESLLVSPACRPGDFGDAGTPSDPCAPNEPWGTAVQGSDVVWLLGSGGIGGGALYRAPLTGASSPTRLGSSQDGNVSGPRGAVSAGADVVFANQSSNSLWRVAPGAAGPALFGQTPSPASPRANATTIFWTAAVQTQIWRRALNGGSSSLVFDIAAIEASPAAYPIADYALVDGRDELVFANCATPTACTILKVPATGGTPTPLATGQRYVGCVGATATHVVWSTALPPVGGKPSIALRAAPLAGGAVADLATRPGTIPRQVLVDGDQVFSFDDAAVFRADLAKPGGAGIDVAVPPGGFTTRSCHAMAVDAAYLYFATARGEVRRVAK